MSKPRDKEETGRGRSGSRGRAVRIPQVSENVEARPPSRGNIMGLSRGSSSSSSPGTSTARTLDDLSLHGNGSHDNGGYGDPGRLGGNGNGSNGNGAPRGPNGRAGRNGNGSIRGEASGGLRGRMDARREAHLSDYDIVRTRPDGVSKQGVTGQQINLVANYFDVRRSQNWNLYHYRVDFAPEEDMVGTRKALVRNHAAQLGGYIFDGASLYTCNRISSKEEVVELVSTRTRDNVQIVIRFKFVGVVSPETPMYIQFYNLIVKKCQEGLKMTLMGRNYFDYAQAIDMSAQRLELWPGFVTVMRQHERQLLLCVEVTHKVIRQDTVLNVMTNKRQEIMQKHGNFEEVKEALRKELVGTIVMTHYNRKTYRVDDIIWTEKASGSFPYKDGEITYIEYYKNKYDITVENSNQPLLVSNPKKRDVRRGQTDVIKLLPELCQMTGLNESLRADFRLMKDLAQHLFQPPQRKVESITRFVNRIKESSVIQTELEQWGLNINGRPIQVTGRVLPKEKVVFSDGNAPKLFETDDKADWTAAFRACRMTVSVPLENWIIIVPQRDSQGIDNLLRAMQNVSRPIGFDLNRPLDVVKLGSINPDAYNKAVTEIMNKKGSNLQLIFVILPNNRIETYSSVKKRCNIDYGIPSQCFLVKNMINPKGLMSIATKVVIQMNAKLGGEPWNISIPLKKMMIVGFDVYHPSPTSKESSIGSMVCTTSNSYGRYYSTMSFHDNRDEVSTKIAGDFYKCLQAWKKINGVLPERIIFYRDGVGEGQLNMVNEVEVEALKKRICEVYAEESKEEAKLSYIVVTKRINSRLFLQSRNSYENPWPGTVVDDVITWPERWDFYLISPNARQGTVSPTSYNILYERNGLDADKIQRLTYKLCHNYYNWSGTVAVPAPCQYAHKLAYLTGVATKGQVNQKLSHLLYFL